MCREKKIKILYNVINAATRHTSQTRKHRKCFPSKWSCKITGKLEERRNILGKKSRHTISWMPGKRHRKSLYCRHREQLWGDKKGNWHYWGSWDLCLLVCLKMRGKRGEEKQIRRELARLFISVFLPTDLWENEGHLWMNREESER